MIRLKKLLITLLRVWRKSYRKGPLVLAHKVNEYVKIEDMKESAKIMALAASMLLGIEE